MEKFNQQYLSDYQWVDIRFELTNRSRIKFNIIAALDKEIIWQKEAKIAIARAIENSNNMLFNKNWTLWNFLFYWPTWSWKTSLVKALAWLIYDDNMWYTHINCERFQHWHEISSLFWAPPSYIWFDKKPWLSQDIVDKPYKSALWRWVVPHFWRNVKQIILFDEVEKAHSDLHKWLMSVLDEWVVYLNNNTTTDLRNSLIFMTSNVWEKEANVASPIWFNSVDNTEEKKDELRLSAIKKQFSPEFLARLDWAFKFEKLWKEWRIAVCKKLYSELCYDCWSIYPNIYPLITQSVYDYLASDDTHVRDVERRFADIRMKLWNIISSNWLEYEECDIIITIDIIDWNIVFYVDWNDITHNKKSATQPLLDFVKDYDLQKLWKKK